MLLALFVTLALETPSAPAPSPSHGAAHAAPHDKPPVPALPAHVNDLYSRHARARIASYLRLRLLELHEEHLDRAAEVLRHRLSVDALLEP